MERFQLKQFAQSASNNGIFGSYQTDNPQTSSDVDAIQSLPAWLTGWLNATTAASKLPRLEEMQGLEYVLCKAIIENYREGIPLWLSTETYYQYSVVSYFDSTNTFDIYYNTTGTHTTTNPAQDKTNWQSLSSFIVSKNGTNCLLEVPQNVKLELNNGTLTLKAGSKVYLANGTLGDAYTTTADISEVETANGVYLVILSTQDNIYIANITSCLSGTIANRPTSLSTSTGLYFATDENKMYLTGDRGDSWYTGPNYSLPIAIITISNGAISSIDQIFNGFGYIGSTVFALPGVKGLIPNGRNADGTLKNTSVSLTSVCTVSYTGTNTLYFGIASGNHLYYQTKSDVSYDETTNTTNWQTAIIAEVKATSGVISDFKPKQVFHAVDYDDAVKYSDFTTKKATTISTASFKNPAVVVENYISGNTWYRVWSDGWIEQGGVGIADSYNATGTITLPKPFSTTNYCITLCGGYGTTNNANVQGYFTHYNMTTTTFSWKLNADSAYFASTVLWYACGY